MWLIKNSCIFFKRAWCNFMGKAWKKTRKTGKYLSGTERIQKKNEDFPSKKDHSGFIPVRVQDWKWRKIPCLKTSGKTQLHRFYLEHSGLYLDKNFDLLMSTAKNIHRWPAREAKNGRAQTGVWFLGIRKTTSGASLTRAHEKAAKYRLSLFSRNTAGIRLFLN